MATERVDIVVTEKGAVKTASNIERIGKSASKSSTAVNGLKNALRGFVGVIGVGALARLGNNFNNATRQLKLFETQTRSATKIYNDLYAVSRKTGGEIGSNIKLFSRLTLAGESLGRTYEQTTSTIDQLNKLVAISGSNAQEGAAGIQQFAQAIGSTVLQGEELKSIMENIPALAKAIADGMGVTVGELKNLGAEGELTAEKVLAALDKMAIKTDEAFALMGLGPTQALTILGNSISKVSGQALTATGAFDAFTSAVLALADSMEYALPMALGLGANLLLLGTRVVGLGVAFRAVALAASIAWRAILGPIGLVVTGISLLAANFEQWKDATFQVGNQTVTLGNVVRGVFNAIGLAWQNLSGFVTENNFFTEFATTAVAVFNGLLTALSGSINQIVGLFMGAKNAIIAAWNQLPAAFTALGASIRNSFLAEIELMANQAISVVNQITSGMNNIPGVNIGQIGAVSFERAEVPSVGGLGEITGAFTTGYEAGLTVIPDLVEGAVLALNELGESGSNAFNQLGASADGAADALTRSGDAAKGAGKKMKETKPEVSELAQGMSGVLGNAVDGLIDGMFELATTGKFNFQDFATGLLKQMAKLLVRALILKPLLGALGFGNGGGFGGGGGLMGFANGGAFANGGTFTNSVVSSPTPFKFANGGVPSLGVMGEAGPEAIMPLQRGANGKLGVQASGGGGGNTNIINYEPTIQVNGGGGSQEQNQELANDINVRLQQGLEDLIDERIHHSLEPGGIANPRGVM